MRNLLKRTTAAAMCAVMMASTGCGAGSHEIGTKQIPAATSASEENTPKETSMTTAAAETLPAAVTDVADPTWEDILGSMSLQEKVEQLIMPAFRSRLSDKGNEEYEPVTELDEMVRKTIEKHRFGGIILFGENISETRQTTELIADMQQANTQGGGKTQLLISVDQEGGYITRLNMGCKLIGNMAIGAAGSTDTATQSAELISEELAAAGFNMDFAPSLDINNNPANPVIGVRSFSDDPLTVSAMGSAFIDGLHSNGIITCIKHFPGHGNTDTDSHTGLPLINKSYDEIKETELVPFAACKYDTDMIMTAHIRFPQIETETYISKSSGESISLPATLSKTVITNILRGDMGYDGVVITDSLQMDAISVNFDRLDTARLALNAGADMLLMPTETRTPDEIKELDEYVDGIVGLVNKGEIPAERINESAARVLKLKEKYGLLGGYALTDGQLKEKCDNAAEIIGSEEHHEKEWNLALGAVTMIKNDYGVLPLDGSGRNVVLCTDYSQVNAVEYAADKLRAEGVITYDADISAYNYFAMDKQSLLYEVENAGNVIIITSVMSADELSPLNYAGGYSAVIDEVIAHVHECGGSVTMLSAQLPYDAARYKAADAQLLCYSAEGMPVRPDINGGNTPAYGVNIPASIYTIFGGASPVGKLPVDIPDIGENYSFTYYALYERGSGMGYVQ